MDSKLPGHCFSLILFIVLACSVSAEENEPLTRNLSALTGCSFYCFLQPLQLERIEVEPYLNLSCTHFVYGFATIDSRFELEPPSAYDFPESSGRYGNYETVQYLKTNKRHVKTLFGISMDKLSFVEMNHSRSLVAAEAVQTARRYDFDGIFLKVDDERMFTFSMESFMETLMDMAVATQKARKDTERLMIVFGFPANRAGMGRLGLAKLQPFVDAFYMQADDVPSTSAPNIAISVDALNPSENVPREDSISYNAENLVTNGLHREKIIIGFSAWSRSYRVPRGRKTTAHNDLAEGPGRRGNRTRRRDGKMAYDEVCDLLDDSELLHDADSSTVSLVKDGIWYSFNQPGHDSLKKKLEWVMEHEFGGVGMMSLYADDKNGTCGQGELPLHAFVGDNFQCRTRREKRGNKACTRMCSFDVDNAFAFNFTRFQANWCSHILMSSASVEMSGGIGVSTPLKIAIQTYSKWKTNNKPLLIVTLGANDNNSKWRGSLMSPYTRNVVVHAVNQYLIQNNIDGVNVAWTLNPLESAVDSQYLELFLQELRHLIKDKLLIVTVSAETTFLSRYNAQSINHLADHIIIEGYRFHSVKSIFTGHHSPMFLNSELLNDPKQTVEGLAYDWVSRGAELEKIVLAFTAQGMIVTLQDTRADSLGAQSTPHIQHRVYNNGKISQAEICEIKAQNTTKTNFIADLGVPYLVNGNDFVAYDDEKSMQIKSIWTSLNKFGGLALFHVEKDNMDGECPPNKPFNLLQTIFKTQVCDLCQSTVSAPKAQANSTRQCRSPFEVSCVYRIPLEDEENKLKSELIPYSGCTELIIEETTLNGDGKVPNNQEDSDAQRYYVVKHSLEQGADDMNMISSVRCNMTSAQFDELMASSESRIQMIKSIQEHLDKFAYTGVELQCNGFLNPQNKASFDKFLKELKNAFASSDPAKCPSTVSLRIPALTTNLNEAYEATTLNSLHHVTLDTFMTSTNTSQLASPLFGSAGQDQLAIDSIIHSWVSSGLSRSSIVISIPAYGIIQKLSDTRTLNHHVGSSTQVDFIKSVPHRELCMKLAESGIVRKTIYDVVAAYATSVNEEWLTFETQETVSYKIKYAIREQLGGVALLTLNDDDHMDTCKQGVFPMLATILRNKCNV